MWEVWSSKTVLHTVFENAGASIGVGSRVGGPWWALKGWAWVWSLKTALCTVFENGRGRCWSWRAGCCTRIEWQDDTRARWWLLWVQSNIETVQRLDHGCWGSNQMVRGWRWWIPHNILHWAKISGSLILTKRKSLYRQMKILINYEFLNLFKTHSYQPWQKALH